MLDSENARLGRELVELQGRLTLGERTEKEGRREALGLRQKLLKGEASMEAVRQEVTRVGGLCGWGGSQETAGVPCAFSHQQEAGGLQCWSHSERSLPRTRPCPPLCETLPRV